MIRIRPYKTSDAEAILSWCQDEKAFYQWTAGVLSNYPITQKEERSMVSDFLGAAYPWILLGLFVAISCSLMRKKEK